MTTPVQPKIPLGSKVRDMISGFRGIATGYYQFLYGCAQYEISPEELGKDGEPAKTRAFDEQRVEIADVREWDVEPADRPIALGAKVRDRITGFQGIATAFYEDACGWARYSVTPEHLHEGQPVSAQWVDTARLIVVEEAKLIMSKQADPSRPGGPQDVAPVRSMQAPR